MRRLVPIHVESTPPELSIARQIRPWRSCTVRRRGKFPWMRFLLAIMLAGCAGSETSSGSSASAPTPELQSAPDSACSGLGYAACSAKNECFWWINTDACGGAAPCVPDRCVDRAQRPFDGRMVCGCAVPQGGAAAYACVRESGSTAIGCQPVPTTCAAPSFVGSDADTAAACACLSRAGHICRAATDIRALCDCG